MKSIKNKKSITFIAVVLFFGLMLIPSVAFADGPVTFSVSFDNDFIVGEEVSMIIRINNALGTAGGQFDLSFDGDILEPKDISEEYDLDSDLNKYFIPGDFLSNAIVGSNLREDGKIGVLWVSGGKSNKDSGILGTIVFEVLDEGNTEIAFSGLQVSDPDAADGDAEFTTPPKAPVESVDETTAKERAIKAAEDAITALPVPVTLADSEAIKDARELVTTAKDRWEAVDSDFSNLKKLEDAEDLYAKERAIFTANNAIAGLPAVDQLKLEDEDVVKAARVLVDAAKSQHGAVDDDFPFLSTLGAAENKIAELKGLTPTPPTGGMSIVVIAGMFFLAAGLLIYKRRRLLSA